jgi:hypothetical protein
MKFHKWNANKKYAEHLAPGWLPDGTTVKFSDGSLGRTIHGNGERSLVSYVPDKLTGMSEARDWFSNTSLLIAE